LPDACFGTAFQTIGEGAGGSQAAVFNLFLFR